MTQLNKCQLILWIIIWITTDDDDSHTEQSCRNDRKHYWVLSIMLHDHLLLSSLTILSYFFFQLKISKAAPEHEVLSLLVYYFLVKPCCENRCKGLVSHWLSCHILYFVTDPRQGKTYLTLFSSSLKSGYKSPVVELTWRLERHLGEWIMIGIQVLIIW